MNKVKTKISERFSNWIQKFKRFFRPKTGDLKKKSLHWNSKGFPAEFRNSNVFSGRKQVILKKKVFIPKMSWNSVPVHKNYKNTGGKHQIEPRFALQ